jgi:DNA helicase II / ATP-dependent DNA helicase PcrA
VHSSATIDLSSLNPAQRRAVTTTSGPLLVLAGAGTGKTRVIVCRIAYLLSQGVAPDHVLAVTFTNRAAREMKERVQDLVHGERVGRLTVGTFHAFCCSLLRQQISRLGYSPRFSIASDAYQTGLLRNTMAELGFTGEGCDAGAWLDLISKAKSGLRTPADLRQSDVPRAADVALVYEHYQQRLQDMDLLDFDDLLMLTYTLWQKHPDVLAEHRERYQYLLIDEYQDTNLVQFQLMATLAGPARNLCVVGDDDQSIYGWRGADLGNILEFERHFPGAAVVRLEQNYRSTGTILSVANAVIARNSRRHEKQLWSQQPAGDPILVVRSADERDEARFVADLLSERQHREKRPWRDFAVLFRSNHQSRLLEEALRARHIPRVLVGTSSFYERKEILDALSLLQVLDNPRDDLNLLRVINVPPRGVGSASISRLKDAARLLHRPLCELLNSDATLSAMPDDAAASLRTLHACFEKHRALLAAGPLATAAETFLREVGYLDGLGRMYKPREDAIKRRDNVLEFLQALHDYAAQTRGASLHGFLEALALQDANDREDRDEADGGGVTLSTVHACKGLEFPVVVVVGLERGLFPHLRAIEERTEEEERRLFYVAITRAREVLVLTHAEQRVRQARRVRQRPSPFLDDIPEPLARFGTPKELLAPASAAETAEFFARMKAMLSPSPP